MLTIKGVPIVKEEDTRDYTKESHLLSCFPDDAIVMPRFKTLPESSDEGVNTCGHVVEGLEHGQYLTEVQVMSFTGIGRYTSVVMFQRFGLILKECNSVKITKEGDEIEYGFMCVFEHALFSYQYSAGEFSYTNTTK